MKKFYKNVSVIEEQKDKYAVLLDDIILKSPLKNNMIFSSKNLANMVADEWKNQADILDNSTMPITSLAYTWCDKVLPDRESVINHLLPYLQTEVICYLSPEPKDLYKKQKELWGSIAKKFLLETKISINQNADILETANNDKTIDQARIHLQKMSDIEITAMQASIALVNSFVISYLFALRSINVEQVFEASFIEEMFQAEKWGTDPVLENKAKNIKQSLDSIYRFLMQ